MVHYPSTSNQIWVYQHLLQNFTVCSLGGETDQICVLFTTDSIVTQREIMESINTHQLTRSYSRSLAMRAINKHEA
jgi:hypothetical protein